MFTGIIQALGKVEQIIPAGPGYRLTVDVGDLSEPPALGGSVAVNGACLTVVELDGANAQFDVVGETARKTTLGRLRGGDQVNLELSLKVADRIEGHFVLGHIDTTCKITAKTVESPAIRLCFEPADRDHLRYVVPKGSVAVDGISLTVAERTAAGFDVAIIPETLKRTTLGGASPGDVVNLETDILVKAVIQQIVGADTGRDAWLTDLLKRSGFGV